MFQLCAHIQSISRSRRLSPNSRRVEAIADGVSVGKRRLTSLLNLFRGILSPTLTDNAALNGCTPNNFHTRNNGCTVSLGQTGFVFSFLAPTTLSIIPNGLRMSR